VAEADIGVLTVRAHVPRVCLDARGTIDLGYLDRKTAQYWATWIQEEFAYACGQDLDALASRGQTFRTGGGVRPWSEGWYDPRPGTPIGPWMPMDVGERRPSDTMAYLSSLAEFRVFDPTRIEAREAEDIAHLRANRRWGHRATHPWFEMVETLTGPRPGTIVLERAGRQAGAPNRRRR
jgi:hypothetical protein